MAPIKMQRSAWLGRAESRSSMRATQSLEEALPGDSACDQEQSQSKKDQNGLVLAFGIAGLLELAVADGDEHQTHQVGGNVLDGKPAQLGSLHDFCGVAGQLLKPRAHEVQAQTQEELGVAADEGDFGEQGHFGIRRGCAG